MNFRKYRFQISSKKGWWWIPVGLIAIMLINRISNPVPDELPVNHPHSMIDTLPVSSPQTTDILTHNSTLITKIEGDRAFDAAQISTRETTKTQMRVFYLGVLAGLSSLLLRKNIAFKRRVEVALLILIAAVYALEVHLDDNFARSQLYLVNRGVAIDSLVNFYPHDTHWYISSQDSFATQVQNAGQATTRWLRKAKRFLKPDMEQIVFFVFPWSVIYLSSTLSAIKQHRRRLTSRSS